MKVQILYLPRKKWPKHIREFFAKQKKEINESLAKPKLNKFEFSGQRVNDAQKGAV